MLILLLYDGVPVNIDELKKRYEIDFKWRDAWTRLAKKHDHGRLQSKQEKIDARAVAAENRIALLIKKFDEFYGV